MKNNRWQRLMRRGVEIVVMLFLVLIFFGLFTTLLFEIFPSGITLSQIVEQRKGGMQAGRKGRGPGGAVVDVEGTQNEKSAATLTRTENEVKSKSASSLAWGAAKDGMKLLDRDAVQTFADASAQINFDALNFLTLGSNSLVIVKRIEKDPNLHERRTEMVVLEGELTGRISASGLDPLRLQITTPSAVARVQGKTGNPKADFRISVNPDHSSSIVVFQGEAQVSAQGRTVRVGENSGVTVRPGQAPPSAVRLPPPPSLSAPPDRSGIYFRELAPRVRLAWAGEAGGSFHLQLARDAGFKAMVLDRRLGEPEFVHGNLKPGSYYWRVAGVEEGREGSFGGARRFEIAQLLVAPRLEVAFPEGPVLEERFLLTGVSAPGVRIFVAGKPAASDASGAFSFEVLLRNGMNLVTVEAVDAAGNVTYRSQYVQGRF